MGFGGFEGVDLGKASPPGEGKGDENGGVGDRGSPGKVFPSEICDRPPQLGWRKAK